MTIRNDLDQLLAAPKSGTRLDPGEKGEEMIEVSEATKRIANAYERFRNTLEPDEQDILRRHAIVRILQRRLPEQRPPQVMAEQIFQELLRANYIRTATRNSAERLARKLEQVAFLQQQLPPEMQKWFLEISAVTIDRQIFPRIQEEELATLMYKDAWHRLAWVDDLVAEEERPMQIFMAVHRALLEADDLEISWHYWRRRWPQWDQDELSQHELLSIAHELPDFYQQLQRSLHHPARDRLARLLRPVAVPYRVLRDMVQDEEQVSEDPERLESQVRNALESKVSKLKRRMSKRAWNSILFLFLTKTILTGLLEVPYELFFLNELHWLALVTNIVFHPVLLFLTATTVRWPGKKNADAIVEQIRAIVLGEGSLPTIVLRRAKTYGSIVWTIFVLVYAVLFLLFFWRLSAVLTLLEFSLVAMFMFVVFLGLVTFLAARIRRSANDLRLISRREGVLGAFLTFFSLPLLEFGRFLAEQIRELNIPLIFMDRFLEAPFKFLIDVAEEWFSFVRERREEIV